ncbi:MAG: Bax inhibitor-1/YccA family protein [Bacteroidales bacterium]|jgi:uncharacterized YccA/Bax inhibitor family protein|nr:Bax inhibitor-1/YccA family protein [Bacteroidales bacterium]
MNITRTSNPTLREKAFTSEPAATDGKTMTLKGTINKTIVLFAILLVAGIVSWKMTMSGMIASSAILMMAAIGGFVLALVTSFVKKASPITAPIYAAFEGIVLGSISSMFEIAYSGIVFQAISLTVLVFGLMLFMYKTGILKASNKFVKGVVVATAAIGIFYLVSFIVGLFSSAISDYLMANPLIGIIVSLIIVVVAALNLILDFSTIEDSVNSGAPKYMEWYAGFGLMVTLVWLYIEILRLLSYFRRN